MLKINSNDTLLMIAIKVSGLIRSDIHTFPQSYTKCHFVVKPKSYFISILFAFTARLSTPIDYCLK